MGPSDALALLNTGLAYWLAIAPVARNELRGWRQRAVSIPDPVLRKCALKKLSAEALNAEAATLFAVLVPTASRPRFIRLVVAYQVMYDYLDAVNEEQAFMPVNDGLQLHVALIDAIRSTGPKIDNYYAHHLHHDDSGYLSALVDVCRHLVGTLPSKVTVTPTLIAAAERCREAQSRNHAVPVEGHEKLIGWSEEHSPGKGYVWWELAAAGVSSVAIHALFAAAARPNTTHKEVQRIEAAYFPPICAISTLLDSLIDLMRDIDTPNHSFAAHYASRGHAAARYATIMTDARNQLLELHDSRRHRIILAGIAGYYLSAPEASRDFAYPTAASAISAAEPTILPILAIMRVRRWWHRVAFSTRKRR
jgi:tetraprenyl-beta-curcumene synthase